MGRSHHGRARGNGRRVNQICHFGVMGGLAPLQGVPLAHRSFIMKHATTKITIPPGCEAGRRWMLGQNPYQKYLLSKNPVGSGRVDVITKTRRKCNCGPRPRGDGSQVGTHIFAELTPSAYPYGHGHSHTHPHGYPPHHHPHPYDPDGLCLTWAPPKPGCGAHPNNCPLTDLGGTLVNIYGHSNTRLLLGAESLGPISPPLKVLLRGQSSGGPLALSITEFRASPSQYSGVAMLSGLEDKTMQPITVIGLVTVDDEGREQIKKPYYRITSDNIISGNHGSATTSCWHWHEEAPSRISKVALTLGPHGDGCGVASEGPCA